MLAWTGLNFLSSSECNFLLKDSDLNFLAPAGCDRMCVFVKVVSIREF